MSIANSLIDTADYVLESIGYWLNRDPRKGLDPYTVDGNAVVNRDGTVFSVIQLKGYGSMVSADELVRLVESWEEMLTPRLQKEGAHELQICFEADEPGDVLRDNFAPAIAQAKRMNLSVEDIFEEKIERYRELCLEESCYLVIYTVPYRMNKVDRTSSQKETENKKTAHPPAKHGQQWDVISSLLRDQHNEAVSSMLNFLVRNSYLHYSLDTKEAVRVIRRQLLGHALSAKWNPTTIDDSYNAQQSDATLKGDCSAMFPRPLYQQIMDHEPEVAGGAFIACGDRVAAPVRISQFPTKPVLFEGLVALLRSARIPYRICFNIKPAGLETNRFDAAISDWGRWASSANKQINAVYRGLSEYETEGGAPIVAVSATACTWAPLETEWLRKANKKGELRINLDTIRKRVQALINRLNDWGSSQADNALADPMAAYLATTAGGRRNHFSPVTPAPLNGIVGLLPITRAGTPWKNGTLLYRTKDGAILPYEQYSGLQSYWITLVSGPMGFGKSSDIASRNFAFLVQPADSPKLPILRGIDIGPSQRPVVDLIRDALPKHRKHEAVFIRFKNHKQYAANPFDTPLGCRRPTSNHRAYLFNLVTVLASSLQDWPSLNGMTATLIDAAYARFDDANFNPNAKRYSPGINVEVDAYLLEQGLHIQPGKSTWWSLVDALFDRGEFRLAKLAQRQAVPLISDLDALAQSRDLISEYPDEASGGVTYMELFSRAIREVVRVFPFLGMPTVLDLSDSPIAVIDMEGVIQRSESGVIQRQNAIFFMVIYRMLTNDFFMDASLLDEFNPHYRGYHAKHIEYLKACKKRFFGDEVHRYSGIPGATAQLDQVGVEARKFFIDLVLGSQVVLDFPKKLRNLASTTVLCGAGGPADIDDIVNEYGFSSKIADALRRIKMPSKDGAEMLMMIDNNQVRRQVLNVMNTEGPRFLWAIATNAADRYVRDKLSEKVGDTKLARLLLAKHFPGGEIRTEQARRQRALGEAVGGADANILDGIVDELLALAARSGSLVGESSDELETAVA